MFAFLRLKGEENTQPIGSWLRVFYSSIHITIAHFSRKGKSPMFSQLSSPFSSILEFTVTDDLLLSPTHRVQGMQRVTRFKVFTQDTQNIRNIRYIVPIMHTISSSQHSHTEHQEHQVHQVHRSHHSHHIIISTYTLRTSGTSGTSGTLLTSFTSVHTQNIKYIRYIVHIIASRLIAERRSKSQYKTQPRHGSITLKK